MHSRVSFIKGQPAVDFVLTHQYYEHKDNISANCGSSSGQVNVNASTVNDQKSSYTRLSCTANTEITS